MKLLEFTSDVTNEQLPGLLLATDSSLVLNSRPVFLPDWGEGWRCRVMPVYRIGRLGKSIPRRFAFRYIDGVSLAARFVPSTTKFNVPASSSWMTAFDGAVSIGNFVTLIPETHIFNKTIDISLCAGENPCQSLTASLESSLDAVVTASALFTLKNGDLLIPFGPAVEIEVCPDTRLKASIDNAEVLNFKIK